MHRDDQHMERKGHSAGFVILTVLLAVVMVVESVIAAWWFPGFLNPRSGKNGTGATSQTEAEKSDRRHDLAGQNDDENADDPDADGESGVSDIEKMIAAYPELLKDTEEIELCYTEEDVEQATPLSAEVSKEEPVVELGDIRVDFKSWNLEKDSDELIVRELPELSEGDDGWTIKAYDFQLASGQCEFSTEVEITLPCGDEENGVYSSVSFNEETGKWEDLYGRLSDDGESYILYTDHFSKKGLKKLKYVYNASTHAVEKNEKGLDIDLNAGVFKEKPVKKNQTRMQAYVFVDRTLLWNMYENKTLDDVKRIDLLLESLNQEDASAIYDQNISDTNAASTMIGVGGAGDNLNTLLKNVGYTSTFVGKTLTGLDIALIMLKIQAEAMKGNNTYWESLKKAVSKYEDELTLSAGTAAAGWGSAAIYGGWVGALVSLTIWCGANYYKMIVPETTWMNTKTPKWEDLYKSFYYTGCKVDAGSESAKAEKKAGKYNFAIMSKPASMTDEKWKKLSKTINQYPLSIEYDYDEDKYVYVNFDKAYEKMVSLYADDIYKLDTVLDDFYKSYSNAFWNLSDKAMYNFVHDECDSRSAMDFFESEYYFESPARGDTVLRPDDEDARDIADKADMSDELVAALRYATIAELEGAFNKHYHKKLINLDKDMSKLEKLMNTRLVFHVNDLSLLPGQEFKDSIYCRDWMKIKANKEYKIENHKKDVQYDYSDIDFITPMRFVTNDPLFKPLDNDLQSIPYTQYYPYTPDFVPHATKGQRTDEVYTCTLYHYLMMGAPDKMEFRNVDDLSHYADQTPVIGEIVFPRIDENTLVADVMINVSGRNDIKELEGMWGPPAGDSPYANSTKKQISLVVQNEGKNNSFTEEYTKEEYRFFEGGADGESRFVFVREPKNDYGTLTMWNTKTEKTLALTVKLIDENTIYIEEYEYYLRRFTQNAEKAVTLHMVNDPPSNYRINESLEEIYEEKSTVPDTSTLSLGDDGSVVLSVQALDATWKHSYQSEKESKSGTDTITYKRTAFECKAQLAFTYQEKEYGNVTQIHKYYLMRDCPAVAGTETSVNHIVWHAGSSAERQEDYSTSTTNSIDAPLLMEASASVKPVTSESTEDIKEFLEKNNVSYIELIYDASGEKLKNVELRIKGSRKEVRKSDRYGDLNETHEDSVFGFRFKPVNK